MFNRFIIFLFLLIGFSEAQAQIQVELRIKRRLYLIYEPIIATVSITNLTGQDITFRDTDGHKWFGFHIVTAQHHPVPPMDLNYKLDPLTVGTGQTVKRTVNLNALYTVKEFGLYRVRASVYFPELQKYFSSAVHNIEITDGKLFWQQVVGVPEGIPGSGSFRTMSLLTYRLPTTNMMYVRVEDKDAGVVYATYPIGRHLSGNEPQLQFDESNRLHILQLVGQKTYLYSKVGLNGEWLGQITYYATDKKPRLKKFENGSVETIGGQMDVPIAQSATDAALVPKLSDRPPGMPLK